MIRGVEIQGLREFSRKLKSADATLATDLRVGLKDIAGTVANAAKQNVPQRSGKLAASIRPGATGRVAKVSMGGARVPYAGFIEYGGSVGKGKSVKRKFVKEGRYLRPAYESHSGEVQAAAEHLIDHVAGKLS